MKTVFKKLLPLIFALFVSLSLASCGGGAQEITTTQAVEIKFELSDEYKIVIADALDEYEETSVAAEFLSNAIESVCGFKPEIITDSEVSSESQQMILLGNTDRKASRDAFSALGINDFAYSVNSESEIVICGGSTSSTVEAVEKFCLDVLNYTEEALAPEVAPVLTVGTRFDFRAEYPYQSLLIRGVSADGLKIAISDPAQYDLALGIAAKLGAYSGTSIQILEYSELTENDTKLICIGAEDRSGIPSLLEKHTGYFISTDSENGLTIGIQASDSEYLDKALERWLFNLCEEEYEGGIDLTYPEFDIYLFDTDEDLPEWNLISQVVTKIVDGATHYKQVYTDREGRPYKAYTLVLEPGCFYYHMGSSNDSNKYALEKSEFQTVKQHINAAIDNGLNVIAGINADFFAIKGDYHPTGLAVKNGEVISRGASGRPWCGFTADGTLVIGADGKTDDITGIVTAVGGSNIIVSEGLPADIDMDDSFGFTPHPRTLVGMREDGTVIMSVIDGRQPKESNGAPLARCANLMIAFGACEAINLDGGGSSCLLFKKNNSFINPNSPSDGTLRKVYNSILVVLKEQDK